MYIPLRKSEDYRNLVLLKENKEAASNSIVLLEVAHAFDEQYTWARKCAEIAYRCIKEGKKKVSVSFKGAKDTTLKGAIITITTNNLLKTHASITNLTSEKYVKIEIDAINTILSKNAKDAIDEIWSAIVHELGHGNIYWQRYRNGQNINDTPDEYEKWHNVISNDKVSPNDIAYLFCYGLYSTYYHEVQAFISQTYSDVIRNLNKMYGTAKNITKEQFWNALVETNTYQTYKSNADIAERLIGFGGMRDLLSKKLKNFGLDYTPEEILSKCKKIKATSNDALKAAYNSAYQWFYKSFKEQ